MKLLLVRHGKAEESNWGQPDEIRRLTTEGREEMKQVSRGIAELVKDADRLCSSPLVRAQETAEFIAKVLQPNLEREFLTQLEPETDPQELCDWLERQQSTGTIIAVGHLPNLGRIISLLTTDGMKSVLEPKKASATLLSIKAGTPVRGDVIWYKTAAELAKIGAR